MKYSGDKIEYLLLCLCRMLVAKSMNKFRNIVHVFVVDEKTNNGRNGRINCNQLATTLLMYYTSNFFRD